MDFHIIKSISNSAQARQKTRLTVRPSVVDMDASERKIKALRDNYKDIKSMLTETIKECLGSPCAEDISSHLLDQVEKYMKNPKFSLKDEFSRSDYREIPVGNISDWNHLYEDTLKICLGLTLGYSPKSIKFKNQMKMQKTYDDHIHFLIADNIKKGTSKREILKDILNSKRSNLLNPRERNTLLYFMKEQIML